MLIVDRCIWANHCKSTLQLALASIRWTEFMLWLPCFWLALKGNVVQLKRLQYAVCIVPPVCILPWSAVHSLHFALTGTHLQKRLTTLKDPLDAAEKHW